MRRMTCFTVSLMLFSLTSMTFANETTGAVNSASSRRTSPPDVSVPVPFVLRTSSSSRSQVEQAVPVTVPPTEATLDQQHGSQDSAEVRLLEEAMSERPNEAASEPSIAAVPETTHWAATSEAGIEASKEQGTADCACGSFDSVCGECLHPECARWYGSLDALFLSRGGPGGGRAVVINTLDQNQNYPGPTLLTAGDAGTGTQWGPQVTVGRLCGCVGWEATYFGVTGASGRQTVLGNNDLAIPGALGLVSLDFFASDQMTVTTEGELHSFEWNKVVEGECWTTLLGFRYLRFRDALNIRAGDPDTSGSDYRIDALNNLFGAQIGTRRSHRGERWGWDFSAKIGLFGNSASQDQFVTDFPHPNPAFYLRDPVGDDEAALALVGELNLGLAYQVTERITARVGYKILWLEGVATAADQLDFDYPGTSSLGVATTGGTYFHGASAGLETRW